VLGSSFLKSGNLKVAKKKFRKRITNIISMVTAVFIVTVFAHSILLTQSTKRGIAKNRAFSLIVEPTIIRIAANKTMVQFTLFDLVFVVTKEATARKKAVIVTSFQRTRSDPNK
jgi:hypothetical protein